MVRLAEVDLCRCGVRPGTCGVFLVLSARIVGVDVDERQLGMRLAAAIRLGDLAMVDEFLAVSPELAVGRVHGGRTALHVVTDWPGYFPNGPQIARRLVDAGADPNALTEGKGAPETA